MSPTILDRWGDFESTMVEAGAVDEHLNAMRYAFSFGVAIAIARYWGLFADALSRPGVDLRVDIVDLLQREYEEFCAGEGRTLQ